MLKKFISSIAIAATITGSLISGSDFAAVNKVQTKVSEDSKITTNVLKYLSALEQNQNFHGTVLVSKSGKIIIDKGYGMFDYEKKIKNTADTKFAIGSDTKQFTALAIMQLQQKGSLNVNDKLSKYLPDFPNGDKITLHNLLTHTSGIPDYLSIAGIPACKNMNDIINLLKKQTLDFQPGKGWKYSNSGYMILACIIEKTSGISYGDYLKKYIFNPLGMKNSGVCYDESKQLFNGKGYKGALINEYVDDAPLLKILDGAGNIYSTVGDMYIWDKALKTEKILNNKYLAMMFKGYTDTTFGKDFGQYGYGWFILNSSYGKKIFHTGGILGFTSVNSRYIDKDVDIIILTNSGGQNILPLAAEKNIMAILSGNKVALPTKKVTVKINPAILKSYEGTYSINNFQVKIYTQDNKLYALPSGSPASEIFPESNTKFYCKDFNYEITFNNENSKIDNIIFNMNNGEVKLNKTAAQSEQKDVQIDTNILKSYVGEYELAPGFTITITLDGDKLFAQATGQGKFQIFPESETKFYYKVVDAQITFVKDNSGKVTKLVLHQSGQDMNGPKKK